MQATGREEMKLDVITGFLLHQGRDLRTAVHVKQDSLVIHENRNIEIAPRIRGAAGPGTKKYAAST